MTTSSKKEILLDADDVGRAIGSVAESLAAMVEDPASTVIVGIRRRGETLAHRIHEILRDTRGWELPLGALDITLYRDDFSKLAESPLIGKTDLEFDLTDKVILLIDDVLFTGRSVHSALAHLVDFGRPRAVRLAVLVDRGMREYPIQADCVGLTVETRAGQNVEVCLSEVDEIEQVVLCGEASS